MRELKKGSLGMLLLHLLRDQPDYGYQLCERLRTRSGGVLGFDEGAIYPLLHDYEQRGLVVGYWEGGAGHDAEASAAGAGGAVGATGTTGRARKGPRRRYYRITDRGVEALSANVAEWWAFADAIGQVLGGAAPEVVIG